MLSKVISATTFGLSGVMIKVEVDVAGRGFPTFRIVGLPNKAIEESKERVRTAIKNSSFEMPNSKLVINLAPADIPKEGSLFDLPIAIGILASDGKIEKKAIKKSLFIGELSLDGKVQPVKGVLPITLLARKENIEKIYVPAETAREAAIIKNISVYPVKTLLQLILHLNGHKKIIKHKHISIKDIKMRAPYDYDFADIKGQENAKRALEIAAAGSHNVHLKGPPGAGKTLLARSFPSIMPDMDEEEIIEVSKIYSVSQSLLKSSFITIRPFRNPHHTISRAGLIGGGTRLTPGEVSFAHRGALFLDEFPEFPRSVLESLRQPMEDGTVTISRARGTVTFPAQFSLMAASNPCPCGYLGHAKKPCKCTLAQISVYKKRVSGPLLDRIDIHVDVPPVKAQKLTDDKRAELSNKIRNRVEKAREIQRKRFKETKIKSNGEMTTFYVKKLCQLEPQAVYILKQAVSRLSLSARSYFKIIKIAQTIADLQDVKSITAIHVSEALQFRAQERHEG